MYVELCKSLFPCCHGKEAFYIICCVNSKETISYPCRNEDMVFLCFKPGFGSDDFYKLRFHQSFGFQNGCHFLLNALSFFAGCFCIGRSVVCIDNGS